MFIIIGIKVRHLFMETETKDIYIYIYIQCSRLCAYDVSLLTCTKTIFIYTYNYCVCYLLFFNNFYFCSWQMMGVNRDQYLVFGIDAGYSVSMLGIRYRCWVFGIDSLISHGEISYKIMLNQLSSLFKDSIFNISSVISF